MAIPAAHPRRALTPALAPLLDLALDLRWAWSHDAAALWRRLDPDGRTAPGNPWMLLGDVAEERLDALASDHDARSALERLDAARRAHLAADGWLARAHPGALRGVAYF